MRLIDADALIDRLRKDPLFRFVEQYGITGVIEAAPTIDAVPIVRCKDCEYFKKSPRLWDEERDDGSCKWINDKLVEQEHYCAWGQRKTDETD